MLKCEFILDFYYERRSTIMNKGIMNFIIPSIVTLALSLSIPAVQAQADQLTNRISGTDRYQTARAIAEEFNNAKCKSAILTSGINFPDALSSSILSKKLNAPLLLVDTTVDKSQEAMNYISSHVSSGGTIYIVGGTAIIGSYFDSTLQTQGYIVKRIGGQDRYDTNMLVVNEVNVPKGTPVFLASGEGFPDALSASSFSGAKQYPILLVGKELSTGAEDYIKTNQPSTVYTVGGEAVVSHNIVNQIRTLVPNVQVYAAAGNDRFDTSGTVAEEFAFEGKLNPTIIYIADGMNFPDALAGGSLAAKTGDPIILVDPSQELLSSATLKYLDRLHNTGIHPTVTALGGDIVVPDILLQNVENVLEGKPEVQSTLPTSDLSLTSLGNPVQLYNKVAKTDDELSMFTIACKFLVAIKSVDFNALSNETSFPGSEYFTDSTNARFNAGFANFKAKSIANKDGRQVVSLSLNNLSQNGNTATLTYNIQLNMSHNNVVQGINTFTSMVTVQYVDGTWKVSDYSEGY